MSAANTGMNYEVAEAIAPTWHSRRAVIEDVARPVADWMLDALAPGAGQTILELAAGSGDTGFDAAAIIGEEGRLLSTDFSPTMLEGARSRGDERGVRNVTYQVIDAERMELDADSVDGALCRFGYMLMDDPAAALTETRRVLRPGGRLALAVWGPPERNPFFTAIVIGLVQGGHFPPPDPDGPGLFSLADAGKLTGMLESAGFGEVRTEEVPIVFALPDVEEYVSMVADTAGPVGLAVQRLTEEEREAVKAQAEAMLERFRVDGAYEIPGVALCAVAA